MTTTVRRTTDNPEHGDRRPVECSPGIALDSTVTEVGSGLDGNRPKLCRLLSDPAVTLVVMEYRDRLARFGVEHLEVALSAHGRSLLVLDPAEVDDDLVRDVTGVRPR